MNIFFGNVFIDMYVKCGVIDIVVEVFLSMKERDVFLWNFILGGLVFYGNVLEILELFV